jgi:uncharacterized protein involved in cysteine biosynthesis
MKKDDIELEIPSFKEILKGIGLILLVLTISFIFLYLITLLGVF